MTALDLIVREVESDLERWCEEPLDGARLAREGDDLPVSLKLRAVNAADIDKNGVHYQRCGGGRRVVRRSARSAY